MHDERCIDGVHSNISYTNIDLKVQNKFHVPMYYKIGVTWVHNGHVFYTPPISKLSNLCNEFTSVLVNVPIH